MEEKRQVPTSEEHALPSCIQPVTDTGRGGRGTRENHAGWVGGGQVALGIHHGPLHLPYPSDGGRRAAPSAPHPEAAGPGASCLPGKGSSFAEGLCSRASK